VADKFGDLIKRTVAGLTGKDASDYKFGDITRKAFTNFTGKDLEEYEFGDLTRTALSAADGALADVRDRYFDDLPAALWKRLFVGLSQGQRDDLIVSIVQYAAVAILAYSFIANLQLSLTIAAAW
jgi:hypothetical protein